MTPAMHYVLIGLLAGLGHLALWAGAFSRLHALGLRWLWLRLLELLIFLGLLGLPAAIVLRLLLAPPLPFDLGALIPGGAAGRAYLGLCAVWGVVTGIAWSHRKWKGPPRELLRCQRRVTRVAEALGHLPCGDRATRWLARLPGNQIFEVETNVKALLVPRLPACLDGLTIVHLSDLHFTGRLTRAFFHWLVDQVNELDGDLVALTGDLIDEPECVGWIGEVLGRVRSRWGAFCIFGNHELRLGDIPLLAGQAEQAGWHYLGGCWRELRVRNQTILLAGNELPWLGPPADLATWSAPADGRRPLRILLSHSPDQIHWARARDFDLMLAGHTHGGQIQLPVIGPLIGQSRYGVRYACGVYHVPPTLLHVSRGVSGVQNLRLNCRPELAKLVLRCGTLLNVPDSAPASEPLSGVPVPAAVSRSPASAS